MGIDSESEVAASLVVGPTSIGKVRIYVEAEGVSLPMDFEPEEALEIAEELRAAAATAERTRQGESGRSKDKERPKGERRKNDRRSR